MKHLLRLLMATTLLLSFAQAKEFIIDNAHSNMAFLSNT